MFRTALRIINQISEGLGAFANAIRGGVGDKYGDSCVGLVRISKLRSYAMGKIVGVGGGNMEALETLSKY